MSAVQIEFKEQMRGRNALHFWVGVLAIAVGVYFWWNGWFSAFAIDFDLAPPALASSYEARDGFSSVAVDGYGSTGAISLVFDTVCLIGWGVLSFFGLMREPVRGIVERLRLLITGSYSWANQQINGQDLQREQAGQKNHLTSLESRVSVAIHNFEKRLRKLEAKTQEVPLPDDALTPEELIERQRQEIASLKEMLAQQESKLEVEIDE